VGVACWCWWAAKGKELDSGFRRNDEIEEQNWIPAFAGMTS
jgi:hypothetical protein